jgi:hypothetical protein
MAFHKSEREFPVKHLLLRGPNPWLIRPAAGRTDQLRYLLPRLALVRLTR